MRTAIRYPALFAIPTAIAVGIGFTVVTGRVSWGATAGLLTGVGLFALVLLGSEVGSTNLDPD